MSDTIITVLTDEVPSGQVVDFHVGPPVNRSYYGSVDSDVASITIPDADFGGVNSVGLDIEIVMAGETLTHSTNVIPASTLTLADFGTTITSSSHTFTVIDPAGIPGRRYDLFINGVDQGPSILYPETTFNITGIPTGANVINLQLDSWDNGNTSDRTVVTGIMYFGEPSNVTFLRTPVANNVTSSGVTIEFSTDGYTAALTQVRTGGGAWVTVKEETGFEYGPEPLGHIHRVTGLNDEADYDFRVIIENEGGDTLTSDVGSFTTLEASVATGNDSLQMRGQFVGSRHHGWRLNHNYIHRSNHVAIRFIQEETGTIERVSKHNRQGEHYHEGNGGNYHVKIVASLNGMPDESTVLGQSDSADDYILTDGPSTGSDRIWIDIDSPSAPVVAGTEYWMVWDSRSEQGNGRSIFNSAQCGDYWQSVAGITDRGPYPGPNDLQLFDKVNKADEWKSLRPTLMPWVCWEMSSGRIRGNTFYGGYYGQNLDGSETLAASRTIEGSQVARQRYTAERTETLDGLWLFWGHTYRYTVDGSALIVTFKNSSGTVLATGSIASIAALNSLNRQGEQSNPTDLEMRTTKTWGYTDFSADVNTVAGQVYDIEFSTGTKGGYALTACFPWPKTTHTGSKYNDGIWDKTQSWANAKAEIIGEGQWTPGAPWNDDERELAIKLTIKGQPKRAY